MVGATRGNHMSLLILEPLCESQLVAGYQVYAIRHPSTYHTPITAASEDLWCVWENCASSLLSSFCESIGEQVSHIPLVSVSLGFRSWQGQDCSFSEKCKDSRFRGCFLVISFFYLSSIHHQAPKGHFFRLKNSNFL